MNAGFSGRGAFRLPSIEGVRHCGDRVPDTVFSGSARNSTTALTIRTGTGTFGPGGFTINVASGGGSLQAPTAYSAPLVMSVTANSLSEPVAGGLVSLTPRGHRLVRIGRTRDGWAETP
jgi:hypothetical protein